jgi:hypothetical protein
MARRAVLWVPPDRVWGLFVGQSKAVSSGFLEVPRLDYATDYYGNKVDLLRGVEVVNATYDWQRQRFGFLLESDRFGDVPDGAEPPSLYYPSIAITLEKLDVRPDAVVLAVPG